MEKKITYLSALLFISMLSSCELVGDIFKAGAYVGIFMVVAVLILIYWLFSFFRRR
ncbi:MAG: hypothetical protein ACO1NU_16860 [Arcticibacter sp.]